MMQDIWGSILTRASQGGGLTPGRAMWPEPRRQLGAHPRPQERAASDLRNRQEQYTHKKPCVRFSTCHAVIPSCHLLLDVRCISQDGVHRSRIEMEHELDVNHTSIWYILSIMYICKEIASKVTSDSRWKAHPWAPCANHLGTMPSSRTLWRRITFLGHTLMMKADGGRS